MIGMFELGQGDLICDIVMLLLSVVCEVVGVVGMVLSRK